MIKNLKDLMIKFQDENACRQFLVQQRWDGNPICPYCQSDKYYIIEGGKRFKCASKTCHKKYSVTVGTVFEASNIPLSTWLPACYLIASHKKGISSVQLGKDLGVTQKTAWFMLHRIRESLKEKHSTLLSGVVELDETYMSRKFGSEYKGSKEGEYEANHSKQSQGAVIGIAQRGGNIRLETWDIRTKEALTSAIENNINKEGTTIMTDASTMYNKILKGWDRQFVNHSKGEFVRGDVHTNRVENFWSVMKRGIHGIYHQISYKHLQRYCDEFGYRYNSRELKDGDRFELTLQRIEGRLTYKQLTDGKKRNYKKGGTQTQDSKTEGE